MMDQAQLKELGITAMGEVLFILKQSKEPSTQTIYAKALPAKVPQLHFEMNPPNKPHLHHHTFDHWEFFKLYQVYYHTTNQA